MTVTSPPAPFDGSTGNVLRRAEPKVRAAGAVALLAPVVLYYLAQGIPQLSAQPPVVLVLAGAVLTGLLTFAAGFATRAVDRVDLRANLKASAGDALDATVGAAVPAAQMGVATVLPRLSPAAQVVIAAEAATVARQVDTAAPVAAPVVDAAATAAQAAPAVTTVAADPGVQRAAAVAHAAELLGINPAMMGTLASLYASDAVSTPVYDRMVSAQAATVEMPAVTPTGSTAATPAPTAAPTPAPAVAPAPASSPGPAPQLVPAA